jgi:hypothetical protein
MTKNTWGKDGRRGVGRRKDEGKKGGREEKRKSEDLKIRFENKWENKKIKQ